MTDTIEATDMIESDDLEWIEFLRDFIQRLEADGFKVRLWDSIEQMEAAEKEMRHGTDCQD